MALHNNKSLPDENVCVDITTTPQSKPEYDGQVERTYNVSLSTVIFAIMSIILWILGGDSHSHSKTSTTTCQKRNRRRLQKPRSCDRDSGFYSCQDTLDSFRAQSCLTISLDDNEDGSNSNEQKPVEAHAQIIDLLENHSSGSCEDTASSLYSKLSTIEMDAGLLKRTRAKTPVFAVGQLERKMSEISEPLPIDASRMLAEQYRALLPPRLMTPFVETAPSKSRNQTLRKIKCQPSLRSLIKISPGTPCYSDSETLVGSDSPSPPDSPTASIFSSLNSFRLHQGTHDSSSEHEYSTPPLSPKSRSFVHLHTSPKTDQDNHDSDSDADSKSVSNTHPDLGLRICMNLLTDELATAFFRHHPIENTDRASGLQILLMIEAYESVQQRVRQDLFKSHVDGAESEDLRSLDRVLSHWLQALYGLYDHSRERDRDGAE